MAVTFRTAPTPPAALDAIVVPIASGRTVPKGVKAPRGLDLAFLKAKKLEGNLGEVTLLPGGRAGEPAIVAVGIGKPERLTIDDLRRASGAATRAAWHAGKVASWLGGVAPHLDADEAATAVASGAGLAAYTYDDYRSKPKPCALRTFTVLGSASKAALGRAAAIVRAQSMARDLVNGPPDEVTPTRLAQLAREVSEQQGLQLRVWHRDQLEAEGMGGLLGVAAGTDEDPAYVEMRYSPADGTPHKSRKRKTLALVGKGITFDSGGLSLKTGAGMMTMKTDMSGAAAVLATMSVISQLQPSCDVIGIFCATENLPGPAATMPGDVLRARNGKTMEVLNTDAEGRLVLADGLSMAVELGADAIVDLATLTGACIVALGKEYAGLMSTDDDFAAEVADASARAGEQTWRLPLPPRYRKLIDSEIADMKNIGGPDGGALTAGLFLKEFVGSTPWVHLDIAGPARAESDDAHTSRGGTGFGVRTLIELVDGFDRPEVPA